MKEFFKKTFTKENMKKFFYSFIWLMVVVFVIDIATKWGIVNHFGAEPVEGRYGIQIIPNFLYIGLSYNQGAAWSLGAGPTGRVIFIIVSIVLGGGLIAYYVYATRKNKIDTITKLALALMIAGAIGNLIDRAFYWDNTVGFSGVVDWIQVYFGSFDKTFPTFNIADSALVIGVIILLVYVIIEAIKDARKDAKEGKYKYSPKELKETEEAKNEENKDK